MQVNHSIFIVIKKKKKKWLLVPYFWGEKNFNLFSGSCWDISLSEIITNGGRVNYTLNNAYNRSTFFFSFTVVRLGLSSLLLFFFFLTILYIPWPVSSMGWKLPGFSRASFAPVWLSEPIPEIRSNFLLTTFLFLNTLRFEAFKLFYIIWGAGSQLTTFSGKTFKKFELFLRMTYSL